jgi:hypothetical protein
VIRFGGKWVRACGYSTSLFGLTSILAVLVALFAIHFGPAALRSRIPGADYASDLGIVIAAVFLLWMALGFSCTQCGARVGWWLMSKSGMTQWFAGFFTLAECPICGYPRKTIGRSRGSASAQ